MKQRNLQMLSDAQPTSNRINSRKPLHTSLEGSNVISESSQNLHQIHYISVFVFRLENYHTQQKMVKILTPDLQAGKRATLTGQWPPQSSALALPCPASHSHHWHP